MDLIFWIFIGVVMAMLLVFAVKVMFLLTPPPQDEPGEGDG